MRTQHNYTEKLAALALVLGVTSSDVGFLFVSNMA